MAVVRAFISVVMLVGFYLLAVVQFVVGVGVVIWASSFLPGPLVGKLGFVVFMATVWAVGRGTWKAIRQQLPEPHGLPLTRDAAPQLWATVDELAAVVGTRAPDEIYLVPEVNAAVEERSRLMGLLSGPRYMYIGVPLLQSFTVAQLRSVLAHELGHYSGKHTRFAGVAYRGRLALARTISQIGNRNVAGWIFRGYGRLYVMVHNSVSQRQELEADRASVQVAGREAAASALREVKVIAAAFRFYMNNYVASGVDAGYLPDDLFGGFGKLLEARADELAHLRDAEPDDERSIWDTHPPLGVRLAAIAAAPESTVVADQRPAEVLVANLPQAGLALQTRVLDRVGRTVLPWEEFTNAAITAGIQARMDGLLRQISRTVDQPVPHVGVVLDLLEAGRLDDIAVPLFPDATKREARQHFARPLSSLLTLAALRCGAARWQHSWSDPARLVARDGADFDITDLVQFALESETVREARAGLAERGIEVEAATHVQQKVTADKATVYAGITNAKVNGEATDVAVLSHGLLLLPDLGRLKKQQGIKRMKALVESGDPAEVRGTDGLRFIPYEEMTGMEQKTGFTMRYTITLHGGETLDLTWGVQSEEVADGYKVLEKALQSVTER
ncbi:M48 family metallopeptidase [Melissospora conviva]|uniref:M48 family metallopeptidase n=1 Tax=Melissospora conviva TaxID=3388432 RepID=UPI003C1857F2